MSHTASPEGARRSSDEAPFPLPESPPGQRCPECGAPLDVGYRGLPDGDVEPVAECTACPYRD